jgi:hypothetical protein
MKRVFVITIAATLMLSLAGIAMGRVVKTRDRILPFTDGSEEFVLSDPVQGALPSSSPGDTMGWTYYDYQHNGTIHKQIVVGDEGDVRFCWMCATDAALANRHVYYNYWKADSGFRWPGNPTPGGVQVDQQLKSGYTTGDMLSDGRAVVAFHERVDANPNAYYVAVAVELATGLGVFDVTAVDTFTWAPTNVDSTPIWPKVAVDINDNIHVVAMNHPPAAGDPQFSVYSRSTDQGWTWEPWFILDTTYDISYLVQTSRTSNKVGIVYTGPREGITNPDYIGQWAQDLYYWESVDGGSTWHMQAENITQLIEDDTFRLYTDCEFIYDNDDAPHFVYTVYKAEGDSAYYPNYSMILHSTYGDLTKSRVSGWGSPPESLNGWWFTSADPGSWRWPADRPNLSVTANGNLLCIFVGNTDDDFSAGAWPNGEIYITQSTDGGATWGWFDNPDSVYNITQSPSPGAIPGECDDDDYPSIAEVSQAIPTAGDPMALARIIYVNDKDGGGIAQEEGTATDNPMLYTTIEAWDPSTGGIADEPDPGRGLCFFLGQNYPNPVSTATTIEYALASPSHVNLTVFDVTGRVVKVLVDKPCGAGNYSVPWNGRDGSGNGVASGVYFYRIVAGTQAASNKLVVVR